MKRSSGGPTGRIDESELILTDEGAVYHLGLRPEQLADDVRRWLRAESYAARGPAHDHRHDAHRHDVTRHDERIRAFCLEREEPLDWERFSSWIEMLTSFYGADILRIKGLLNVADVDRPVAIHGVQHLFHPPVQLEAWPDEDRRSRLVFIVRDLEEAMFAHTLKAFLDDGRRD